MSRGRRPAALAALAVFAAALAVFSPSARSTFQGIDDDRYVFNNPRVLGGLTAESASWALRTRECEFWHPVTWLSLMADASAWGNDPRGYHLTNVVLHAAASAALCLLLASLGLELWACAMAAALFAVHPLRVESAAWISERKGLLSALFAFLSAWGWTRAESGGGRGWRALSLAAFALSLASKPVSLTLPLLLPLLRRPKRPSALLPYALLSLAMLAATFAAQRRNISASAYIPWTLRLSDSVTALVFSLKKTLWPSGLTLFYRNLAQDPPLSPGLSLPFLCLLVLAALGWASWKARRSWPEAWKGLLWYAVAAAPVLGLVRNTLHELSDRYSYIPHAGLALALAGLLSRLELGRLAGRWLAVIAFFALSGLSLAQQSRWTDLKTLCEYSLEVEPRCGWTHNTLGALLIQEGRLDEARERFEEAARLRPRSPQALNNLGVALADAGAFEESVSRLKAALELRPDLLVDYNLAAALFRAGRLAESRKHAQRALSAPRPYRGYAEALMGALLCRQGGGADGLAALSAAAAREPLNAEARANLGAALALAGRSEGARAELERALTLKPGLPEAEKTRARLSRPGRPRAEELGWASPMILLSSL